MAFQSFGTPTSFECNDFVSKACPNLSKVARLVYSRLDYLLRSKFTLCDISKFYYIKIKVRKIPVFLSHARTSYFMIEEILYYKWISIFSHQLDKFLVVPIWEIILIKLVEGVGVECINWIINFVTYMIFSPNWLSQNFMSSFIQVEAILTFIP